VMLDPQIALSCLFSVNPFMASDNPRVDGILRLLVLCPGFLGSSHTVDWAMGAPL